MRFSELYKDLRPWEQVGSVFRTPIPVPCCVCRKPTEFIDTLILTKSISRFGRNVVDSISTIRKLKEYGVECIFEKENIHTFDPKSSFILTIMTAMAENESMSISENVTWGMRQGFAQGKIALPYSHFLGYRKGEDGPEVVEDEAAVVRTIYRRYLEGNSPGQIVKELEAAGIPSPTSRAKWHSSTITSMLTNPCYKGLTIRQKTFTTDFLTHKSKKKRGRATSIFHRKQPYAHHPRGDMGTGAAGNGASQENGESVLSERAACLPVGVQGLRSLFRF